MMRNLLVAASGAALLGAGCFLVRAPIGPPVCVKTVVADVDVPTQQAADILIVVDNSGSMAEEQASLAQNFLNTNPAECPLQDLTNIPAEYKNPRQEQYTNGGPLEQCGFIQIVAAFDNDFQIGVITTDVGLCDNREAAKGPAGWGYRPQRGCLHPDSAPGGTGRKVIARADLADEDATNDNLAQRFGDTLANIGTYGSPYERGLDAVNIFLNPEADRHPDCLTDLDTFRRDNASLVVIFLTDENDCSHGIGDGLTEFGNELANETCGEFPEHVSAALPPANCYVNDDALPGVASYANRLRAREPNMKVAVIAGAIGDDDTPNGCIVGDDGAPDGACFPSGGLSNFTSPGLPCAPDTVDDRGGLPCCIADAGDRYYELADEIGRKAKDSICNANFRATMLDLAAFVAAVDSVLLAEPPDDPDAVLVVLEKAGTKDEIALPLLSDEDDCATVTGYKIEDDKRVVLCGDAKPGPGDELHVRARAPGAQEVCNDPILEASGGGANCSSSGGALAIALAALARAWRRRSFR